MLFESSDKNGYIPFSPCNLVHGGWTEWKPWDECPVICGGGIQSRSRNCSNPPPANGGNDCEGEGLVSRSCNESPCPGKSSTTEISFNCYSTIQRMLIILKK